MISKYKYKNLTWVDLENPTDEELVHISEEYDVPLIISEEMRSQSLHSKVDIYPNFIYLILHFPRVSLNENRGIEQEVDFIISKDFIITTHYEFIESLHEFSKTFEVEAVLEKRMDMDHAGFLFYHLIKSLYYNSRRQLHEANILIKETEKEIFEGKEGQMVQSISNINRMLLDYKQALRFHKEVLDSFEIAAKQFFGEKFNYYISSIIGEYNKTQKVLDGNKEILDDLRETNDSLLASKTRATMKILTVITFLMMPVAVLSDIFVINSRFLQKQNTHDYYMVVGFMFLLCLIIFVITKAKKWF